MGISCIKIIIGPTHANVYDVIVRVCACVRACVRACLYVPGIVLLLTIAASIVITWTPLRAASRRHRQSTHCKAVETHKHNCLVNIQHSQVNKRMTIRFCQRRQNTSYQHPLSPQNNVTHNSLMTTFQYVFINCAATIIWL